jgi:hypothetical protein
MNTILIAANTFFVCDSLYCIKQRLTLEIACNILAILDLAGMI